MSPRGSRRLARVGMLVLLAGCTGGDKDSSRPAGDSAPPVDPLCEQDACLCEDPQVSVGTGDDSFVPLEEGDPVMMVHGPQGGWHMLGSVRVAHTTEVVNIRFVIDTLDGVVVADNNLNVLLISEEECAGSYPGMYAYLSVEDLAQGDLDTPPELLSYETLRMTGIITDQEGRVAEDSVLVTATPDPQDVEDGTAAR